MYVCYFYVVITSTYSVQNIFFVGRVQQLNLETVSEADWWVYINPFTLSLFSFLYFYRIQQLVMESLSLGHSSTDWVTLVFLPFAFLTSTEITDQVLAYHLSFDSILLNWFTLITDPVLMVISKSSLSHYSRESSSLFLRLFMRLYIPTIMQLYDAFLDMFQWVAVHY